MTTQIRNFVDLDELTAAVGPDAEILLVQGGQAYRVTVSRLLEVQQDGRTVGFGKTINVVGNATVTADPDTGVITITVA